MNVKKTAKPTAPAVVAVTIGSGSSDNILKTMSVIGDRMHKKVARAISHDAFFLCSINAFASSNEILFTAFSGAIESADSSSISSFKR